jgi:DNA-binding GntR family transcriptional regulator
MPPRRRLRAPALHEAIADHLRERILVHDLAPGSAIDEAALASFYGVLRVSVRDAVNVLFGEALVDGDEARGMAVMRLGEAECREALELHALLQEQLSVRRARGVAIGETLHQLLALAERRVRLAFGDAAQRRVQA